MNQGIIKSKLDEPFITESGHCFINADVAYKTWGKLNASRDNVIVICHALTGHAAADEWFPGLIGNGRVADPAKSFIICINIPGSCYGSIGPWTINTETGSPYKNNFPAITIRDMVKFQQLLLDQLDIRGIELIIGGSLGGMQALEFIIVDNRIKSAALIAMGKSHTPWAIGISHAQRSAIYSDLKWKNGDYEQNDAPYQGIAAARMMAMITYRTPEDYNRKFGRKLQNEDGQFQVESYLNYQGDKLAKRFDALSYVSLTKSMDTHDVARERGSAKEVLSNISIPVAVIGINSDHLYPVYEQKELAALLNNATYNEITSDYGHDAFLIEFEQLNEIIEPFYNKHRNRLEKNDTVKSL